MHRSAPLAVALLAATLALSGCTTSVGGCSDFIALGTPQARFDAAPIVVVATVTRTSRTVEPDAVYPVYRAHVVQVLKGGLRAADLDLIDPSDQCVTYGQPAGGTDHLAGVRRAVLYLGDRPRSKVWQLVTPGALDALQAGADLPFSTESPTPSASTSTAASAIG